MVYEFDGNIYKEASNHQKNAGLRVINDLQLTGYEKILDLGCGDGVLTDKLAKLVPNGEVIGIDFSKGMIKVAKEFERFNLYFILMDINEIEFENQFDIIFSNAALHWLNDHEKLIKNCYKGLKQNGLFRVSFAGDGTCSYYYPIVKKLMGNNRFSKYFKSFNWPYFTPTVSEYEKIMKKSDFKEIKIWIENADWFFDSQDIMIKWIEQPSIVPFLNMIDEIDKNEFRRAIIDEMINQTKQPNGKYFETFRRINISARK